MATQSDARDKIEPESGSVDRGHDIWARTKIERGLDQSRERETMIPLERVRRDFAD